MRFGKKVDKPEEPPMTRMLLPCSLLAYLTWSVMFADVLKLGVGWMICFVNSDLARKSIDERPKVRLQ